MFNKSQRKPTINPWSDDHPEKQSADRQPYGVSQQLKGLFSPTKMLDSVFGSNSRQEYYPSSVKTEKSQKRHEELIFSYKERREDYKLKEEINVVLSQLKQSIGQLQKKERSLTAEISKIRVEQLPPKTGIYYLRYLEWLLNLVKQLRLKIDEGRAWLTTFNSRQKKKLGYWKMYKKHGTTFGLSYERTMATQTG